MLHSFTYYKKGGAAHAVTIHLAYNKPDNVIWIKHFISDRTIGSSDPGGKFLEAVRKLTHFGQGNNSVSKTIAYQEFYQHYKNMHFPGLGVVKQLSIRHHIEIMAMIL